MWHVSWARKALKMTYLSVDEAVLSELRAAVESIVTVGDLLKFVRDFRSPTVGELIRPAIEFFIHECKTPEGRWDRKTIRERQRMGLRFRLTEEHQLTPEICDALRQWMLLPEYGRNIGTDFLSNQLSVAHGINSPRYVAFDLLTIVKEKIRARST